MYVCKTQTIGTISRPRPISLAQLLPLLGRKTLERGEREVALMTSLRQAPVREGRLARHAVSRSAISAPHLRKDLAQPKPRSSRARSRAHLAQLNPHTISRRSGRANLGHDLARIWLSWAFRWASRRFPARCGRSGQPCPRPIPRPALAPSPPEIQGGELKWTSLL